MCAHAAVALSGCLRNTGNIMVVNVKFLILARY